MSLLIICHIRYTAYSIFRQTQTFHSRNAVLHVCELKEDKFIESSVQSQEFAAYGNNNAYRLARKHFMSDFLACKTIGNSIPEMNFTHAKLGIFTHAQKPNSHSALFWGLNGKHMKAQQMEQMPIHTLGPSILKTLLSQIQHINIQEPI